MDVLSDQTRDRRETEVNCRLGGLALAVDSVDEMSGDVGKFAKRGARFHVGRSFEKHFG